MVPAAHLPSQLLPGREGGKGASCPQVGGAQGQGRWQEWAFPGPGLAGLL